MNANPLREFKRVLQRAAAVAKLELLPERVYHYTTAAGFEGIVSANALRATNFGFLNDPSELTYGQQFVWAILDDAMRTTDVAFGEFVERVSLRIRPSALPDIYVTCFTAARDDLGQWRAYGNANAPRYSIGFDTASLRGSAFALTGASFDRVVYTPAEQHAHVAALVSNARNCLLRSHLRGDDLDPFVDLAVGYLAKLLPRLKTPAYVHENEWRAIVPIPRSDMSQVVFDTSRGILRPYVMFPLHQQSEPHVVSVHVMASNRPEAATKAAEFVLRRANIGNVKPLLSCIPFAE